MQLYVADYLADTAHLNAAQSGAYLHLLMNYWQRGKALDNTGNRLAFVARMTIQEWEENQEILSEFFQIDGQIWTHNRVEADLAKVKEKSEQASYAGKRSAVQRTFNERSTDVQRSLNHKEEEEDKDNKKTSSFDSFWSVYPRKTAKGAAIAAWVKALKKTTAEEIIKAAQAYRDDPNREEGFTAHASTWLNQERWLDDPLPVKSLPVGSRGSITTPTVLPPRFTSEDVPKGSPMPKEIRELLGVADRTQTT
jgi:uncharacterized protein YdaU (DUF1376 family)